MYVRLSELIQNKGAAMLITPKMVLKLLKESNEIGRMNGNVNDMIIFRDTDGHLQYTLLPEKLGQN